MTMTDLTTEQYGIIASAKASPDWMLSEHDYPAQAFEPLVKLKIFNESIVYENGWPSNVTAETVLEALEAAPHHTVFKLTEYGNKVHHDHLYKWYIDNPAHNITSLWDDAPIQSAAVREPYKTPEQLAIEAKLARWNNLAKG